MSRTAAAILSLLISLPASAGIIAWEFTGAVTFVNRQQSNLFLDVSDGMPIVGGFSYAADMQDNFADREDIDDFDAPLSSFNWFFSVGSTSAGSQNGEARFGKLQVADNEGLTSPYTRDRFFFGSSTDVARLAISLGDPMLDPADGQPDAIDGLTGKPLQEIALEKFGCNGSSFTRVDGVSGSCISVAALTDPATGSELAAVAFRIDTLARVPTPATLGLMTAGLLLLLRRRLVVSM